MKAWQIPLWAIACLLAAGCRTNPEITALERENRYLEDRIYDLQDEADRAKADLDKCRRGNQSQRDKNAPVSTQIETSKGGGRSPRAGGLELNPPGSPPPSGEADDGLPRIIVETPKEPLPPGEIPDRFKSGLPSPKTSPQSPPKPNSGSGSGAAPKFSPGLDPQRGSDPAPDGPAANEKTSQSVGPAVPAADFRPPPATRRPPPGQSVIPVSGITLLARTDSAQVDRITLNQLVAAGWDADGRPGDDGICLLVEPRDAQGRLIAAAGPLSVVLLDRGLPGEAARVARWDLTAHQVAAHFRRMPDGDGIYLELPWPSAPPVHSRLHLVVRFTTRDGRNLQTRQELDIALANQTRASRTPPSGTGILSVASPSTGETPVPPASNPSPLSLGERAGVRALPPAPKAATTWQATRLPPETLDERGTGETPAPLTPVPLTPSSDESAPAQELSPPSAATDILPMPERRTGETPASANRPVWSPYRR